MTASRWCAAGLLLAVAAPAHGVERWSGVPGSYSIDQHARLCFVATFTGAWTAVATGSGFVTTEDRLLSLTTARKGRPADRFADAGTASHSSGDMELCVGGVDGTVVSGSAVYTLVVHQLSGESAVLLQCTFSRAATACR